MNRKQQDTKKKTNHQRSLKMNKIAILEQGHEAFKRVKFKANEARFKKLVAEGQNPKALFIGCSDSRVMPNMITSTNAGDLFIVRNIGNFVPTFKPDSDFHATAAAIEYAVSILEVSDIIVCGHSDCGAIAALYKSLKTTPENIHTVKWLQLGTAAKNAAEATLPHADLKTLRSYTEKLSVIFQLENLLTYPGIKRRTEEGTLFLHGWHYDLASGHIEYYDDSEMIFKML